ncbi:MAG: penicillin-binding transpeptidase domain-containing protein [Clostridia bacterium]|jgi:peptidoglycan glycosyltransferase
MKILSRRSAIVIVFLIAFVCGTVVFIGNYIKNAPAWVQYSSNINNQSVTRTIYDRNGLLLEKTVNGAKKYNSSETIRTAVMQTVGDSNGDVGTGAQVVFKKQLSGWDFLNGIYSYGKTENSIKLTIDANLCAVAYNALDGRKGTVGVYNYKTGEILCMVSSPSFDPENPPDIMANQEKYSGVYINRLLSAAYPPGSVFKLVTAAAAIDNIPNIQKVKFRCNGELNIGNQKVTCPKAHGSVTIRQALAVSCNVTFGRISLDLGSSVLQKYAEKAGFNSSLDVDGIKTAVGKVDATSASGVDLAWLGVGQYTNTANPLNFMAYVGAIANKGIRVIPRLLENSSVSQTQIISAKTANIIKEMMRNDVLSNYGEWNYSGLKLCAKSGTAQLSEGEEPDAWFVGFIDRSDYPLAFVVVVENGGAGSTVAGPVAGKVLQKAIRK